MAFYILPLDGTKVIIIYGIRLGRNEPNTQKDFAFLCMSRIFDDDGGGGFP